MAGHRTVINGATCFIDYQDGDGEAVVNGRVWRWTFHDYLGPTFLRADGEPRACQCPTVKGVWVAFEAWLKGHNKRKSNAKRSDLRDNRKDTNGKK